MEDCVLITNIQRFSLHDGPGIRTTVFCKGCSLHCPWCANPENIKTAPESYSKDGHSGVYGQWISYDELERELLKDRMFYEQVPAVSGAYQGMPGGITFSGGEPLLQLDALRPLLQKLHEAQIHLCVETCLFVPSDCLQSALNFFDLFYVDLKILEKERCSHILGGDLEQYFSNLRLLCQARKPFVFRVPVIGGFTDGGENRQAVAECLERFRPIKVELIKEHNLGSNKYLSLGRKPLVLDTVTDEEMQRYQQEIIQRTGLETEICKI